MSGIFGIVHFDGAPVDPAALQKMRVAMAHWERDDGRVWSHGAAGLAQLVTFDTPESRFEAMPLYDPSAGLVFTAAGRVDNREDLCRELGLSRELLVAAADTVFLLHAYRRWGEKCCEHVLGDWSFAAWHPAERRLILARDHFGITALFYHASPTMLAFASDRKALLAAGLTPITIDELYVAQVLVDWPACHGERTVHLPIKRLPPAHCLTAESGRVTTRCYWRLEDTPIRRRPRRSDYVEEARHVHAEAVRARLRSIGHVGATLSGGLDSSYVTADAARLLRAEGKRLLAFTSVPLYDPTPYVGERFGDEGPLAAETARFVGNIEHHMLKSEHISPIQGCRELLRIQAEPAYAAAGHYWIFDLRRTAAQMGCKVLLVARTGNFGLSWNGHARDQRPWDQMRLLGIRRWMRDWLTRAAPRSWVAGWRRLRTQSLGQWCRWHHLQPDFARRLGLREICLQQEAAASPQFSRQYRLDCLMPGKSAGGAIYAQDSADCGISVRDPTGDPRVLAFSFSVPDDILIDPDSGLNRWLIREAMHGFVPDAVRLNRNRGIQSGDVLHRFRQCADEAREMLDELARGVAVGFVDVAAMRESWLSLRQPSASTPHISTRSSLLRAMLAGLFLNRFLAGSADDPR